MSERIFRFVDADTANELRYGRNEARWKYSEGFEGFTIVYHWKCSECGGEPYYGDDIHEYRFCPYCGARMESEEE